MLDKTIRLAFLLCTPLVSCQRPEQPKDIYVMSGPAMGVGDYVSYPEGITRITSGKTGFMVQIKVRGEWNRTGTEVKTFIEEARRSEKWYKEAGYQTQILRLDLEPFLMGTPVGRAVPRGKITAITVVASD